MTEIDAKSLFQSHKNKNAIATLVLRRSDHPYDSDVVEIDSDFRVKKIIGRGQQELNTAITSIYVFRNDIFNFIPKEFCNIEKDVISGLYDSEDIYGYLTEDYIKDIGTFERYENAKKYFESKRYNFHRLILQRIELPSSVEEHKPAPQPRNIHRRVKRRGQNDIHFAGN